MIYYEVQYLYPYISEKAAGLVRHVRPPPHQHQPPTFTITIWGALPRQGLIPYHILPVGLCRLLAPPPQRHPVFANTIGIFCNWCVSLWMDILRVADLHAKGENLLLTEGTDAKLNLQA